MKFYDSHLHNCGTEQGGILVGLEGEPFFEGTLNNLEVSEIDRTNSNYYSFYYVTMDEIVENFKQPLLKYHPRREKYTPEQVIESIEKNNPDCVMIDSLNEPGWQAYDYWRIARACSETTVILPHAGGYLIQEFIKICHFQPNVWIDFSLTHTNFGSISNNPLTYIDDAIRYALHSPFKARVLMGSDLPFFDQMAVVRYYDRLGKVEMLNDNFERLMERIIH